MAFVRRSNRLRKEQQHERAAKLEKPTDDEKYPLPSPLAQLFGSLRSHGGAQFIGVFLGRTLYVLNLGVMPGCPQNELLSVIVEHGLHRVQSFAHLLEVRGRRKVCRASHERIRRIARHSDLADAPVIVAGRWCNGGNPLADLESEPTPSLAEVGGYLVEDSDGAQDA
jgi:hypothetical protein